jgi:hypothetical protein
MSIRSLTCFLMRSHLIVSWFSRVSLVLFSELYCPKALLQLSLNSSPISLTTSRNPPFYRILSFQGFCFFSIGLGVSSRPAINTIASKLLFPVSFGFIYPPSLSKMDKVNKSVLIMFYSYDSCIVVLICMILLYSPRPKVTSSFCCPVFY